MSNSSYVQSTKRPPRVLFFGMQGSFSLSSLVSLLESRVEICAIVIPGEAMPGTQPLSVRCLPAMLPLVNSKLSSSIISTAWISHIPIWEVFSLSHPDTIAVLAAYSPDIICVACFSLFIPHAILNLPLLGCLNVHPSFLPANRGPVPLFWTFREGHRMTGVTIHLMNEVMDSGDILSQEPIMIPDGITYDQLEFQCGTLGGKLLSRTVWDLYEGRAVSTPQEETAASYHSFPGEEDFVVHTEAWDARHLYNFIHGISSWHTPVILYVGDEQILVTDCISYSHKDAYSVEQTNRAAEILTIPCKTGFVLVSKLKRIKDVVFFDVSKRRRNTQE